MKRPGQVQLKAPEQVPAAEPAGPASTVPAPMPRKQVAAQPTPQATPQALRQMTADAIERLGLLNIRAVQTPATADFASTALLLGLAQRYSPSDLSLIRRRGEAAWGAGDTNLLMELTSQAIKLDPTNTVAQLRLISSRLAEFQTVEERLSRIETFLGPKGSSLDASIRSRLALDAALLYRERGEDAKFVEKLKQATQLDSTNKEAAILAMNYYTSHSTDPVGTLEMLTNLLYADPIDPNVHYELATHLASLGAFNESRRFHEIYKTILKSDGSTINYNLTVESHMLAWRCEGAKVASDAVRKDLYTRRADGARATRKRKIDESTALGGNLSALRPPDEFRLEPRLEYVRLATATVLDDQTEVKRSLHDLTATFADEKEQLSTANSRVAGMTEAQANAQISNTYQDLILWRLLTNIDTDKIEADLAVAFKDVSPTSDRRVAIAAWQALRSGDAAGAITACDQPCDDPMSPWIQICRAEAMAQAGDVPQAVKILTELSGMLPLTTMATYAMERSSQLAGQTRKPGNLDLPITQTVAAYTNKIPRWIDSMITQPRLFQAVSVDMPPPRQGALERSPVTLRIKNISPIALSLGSDNTISSRFVFNPMLEMSDQPRPLQGEPEVFEVDRRFRLLPNEEIAVTLRPDAGIIGFIAENAAAGPSRLRYRVLQGFRGSVVGAGCVEVNTATTAKEPLLEANLTPEQLEERINTADDPSIAAILTGARALLIVADMPAESFAANPVATMAKTLAAKYPTWSTTARTFCAAMMPPSSQTAVLKELDAAIKADPDADIRLIAVLTRVTDPADPLLAEAAKDADPRLVQAAALQASRLATEKPTYSKIGTSELLKHSDPRTLLPPGGR
ncbi:MAG: hypothetical protein NTV94_00655 [Planctomycetota bacterium]|nr:hypothetical protein [Planctomycetota bacterium]